MSFIRGDSYMVVCCTQTVENLGNHCGAHFREIAPPNSNRQRRLRQEKFRMRNRLVAE